MDFGSYRKIRVRTPTEIYNIMTHRKHGVIVPYSFYVQQLAQHLVDKLVDHDSDYLEKLADFYDTQEEEVKDRKRGTRMNRKTLLAWNRAFDAESPQLTSPKWKSLKGL